ncbi:ABC transporter-like protein [Mycolicibacterium mageritense DSM 44476 = CIP 104973]|uniref:Aliphatic sulfonates import ATP-binding protein SsuB n=1 Tax=Mycolicibacterium mageritense TaxID=53462 RepID=A0ABM7I2Y9_MYCME|nr:aliphatic sulfonates import ATP-binding protein SsuB [Mycolicibacterium mageritense]GJJ19152.1 aliphatic sulfonates import ATP-binding protein SsuB [Mycolicibacterium mageritense]CDO26082.1 ABC transporter-like protein [Mycolicibacterium mageritense DSM 44476 = CIP 104973]
MTVTDAVVIAKGVRKRFGTNVVLDDLDLEIRAGEFVALLGRSGSGKSTFLRALGALDGDVDGHLRVPERRAIVFQDPRLLPWQRVLANVTIGLPATRAVQQGALAALAEVNLADKAKVWPRTLSGGEAQRVALARALVREPQLLLLDEPFGALDALTRLKMHGLLLDLYRRHVPAVLLVTHDVDEAIALADRVIVLTDGVISLDVEVALAKPRARDGHEFVALRRRLLAELGVSEDQA